MTIPKIQSNPEKTVGDDSNHIAIPIFIVFRALGIESDKKIIEYITGDTNPEPSSIEYQINTILYNSLMDGDYILS